MIQQQDIYFLSSYSLTQFITKHISLNKICFSLQTQKKNQISTLVLCQKILSNYQILKQIISKINQINLQNSQEQEINQYFLQLALIYDFTNNNQFPDRRRRLDKLTRNTIQILKNNQNLIDDLKSIKDVLKENQFDTNNQLQYFRIREEKYQQFIKFLQSQKINFEQTEFNDVIKISTKYFNQIQQYGEFQSISSTLPVRCLNEYFKIKHQKINIIDLCAAPGSKTIQLLDSGYQVQANEFNQQRYKQLVLRLKNYNKNNFKNKIKIDKITNQDGIKLIKNIQDIPDCVLIDPTCSGSGDISLDQQYAKILEIKQDIDQNEQQEQLQKLSTFQKKIVSAAMEKQIKLIVYSTCSVNREENEDVVQYLLEQHQNYKLVNILPSYQQRSKIFNQTISTGQRGQDGFYVAMFQLQ